MRSLILNLQKMNKTFTLLALLISVASFSQTTNYNSTDKRINAYRSSFWFEGNLNGTIARYADSSAKWQYQLDLQYRRMSDANYVAGGSSANILQIHLGMFTDHGYTIG